MNHTGPRPDMTQRGTRRPRSAWRRDVLATSLALASAAAVTWGVVRRSPTEPGRELAETIDDAVDAATSLASARGGDGRHLGFDAHRRPPFPLLLFACCSSLASPCALNVRREGGGEQVAGHRHGPVIR